MKQIVIATDGSPSATEAVDVGLELAKEQGADVTFVHVTPPDEYVVSRPGPGHPRPHHEPIDESETALTAAEEAAKEAGVSYALERISGDAVDTIVAVANAKNADLIVVGSRGLGPFRAALLGSVSRGVLDDAKRPVLIVKAEKVPAGVES
jgi:nucleotide-binding universal stress UspA family protein